MLCHQSPVDLETETYSISSLSPTEVSKVMTQSHFYIIPVISFQLSDSDSLTTVTEVSKQQSHLYTTVIIYSLISMQISGWDESDSLTTVTEVSKQQSHL